MSLNERLMLLLKSLAGEQLDEFSKKLDEQLGQWERRLGLDEEGQKRAGSQTGYQSKYKAKFEETGTKGSKPNYSDSFLKDLAAFGLTPPVTLAELKKARNRELKKFPPDRFEQEPEKKEAAGRIAQILTDTYERLVRDKRIL